MSQSDGRLAIWHLNPAGGAPVQTVGPWHAHSLRGGVPTEAWISFFKRGSEGEDGSFVVSGADDGLMKGWDVRVGGANPASPAFVCKEHGAGVTAGQWHPTRQHTFARYLFCHFPKHARPLPSWQCIVRRRINRYVTDQTRIRDSMIYPSCFGFHGHLTGRTNCFRRFPFVV